MKRIFRTGYFSHYDIYNFSYFSNLKVFIKDGKSFDDVWDENEEILTLALMGQASGSSSPQVIVRNLTSVTQKTGATGSSPDNFTILLRPCFMTNII